MTHQPPPPRPTPTGGARALPPPGQLAAILAHAPFGIVVVSPEGEVTYLNSRCTSLGLADEHGLKPRYADDLLGLAQQARLEFSAAHGSVKVRRGGIKLAVAVSAQPEDDGTVLLYLTDASETKRMESARRDFVANVSHELKTPVGALALLSEALLESADDPDSVHYFGSRINKEALRMGNMINELISLSKLQGAASLPDMVPVDIAGVIAEAVARNHLAAENANITLAAAPPHSLTIMGDRQLLITAVANLISNAINYSPHGSTVEITATTVAADADLAGLDSMRLSVTDHGIGIAEKHHARVFERFFRVDKARSRSTGGTGLGLAIVKHVAHNHGGRVHVASALGQGSTFTLILPITPPTPLKDAP